MEHLVRFNASGACRISNHVTKIKHQQKTDDVVLDVYSKQYALMCISIGRKTLYAYTNDNYFNAMRCNFRSVFLLLPFLFLCLVEKALNSLHAILAF